MTGEATQAASTCPVETAVARDPVRRPARRPPTASL